VQFAGEVGASGMQATPEQIRSFYEIERQIAEARATAERAAENVIALQRYLPTSH
jgi:hypothetical protein